MIIYLSVEELVALHHIGIDEFGGIHGLRDMGLLESACYQPQQSFGGEDLYPTIWLKAAVLGYSLSENQPFLDGNKRIAALSMMVFLDLNGFELRVPSGQVYETIIQIATKQLDAQGLAAWLATNCIAKGPSTTKK